MSPHPRLSLNLRRAGRGLILLTRLTLLSLAFGCHPQQSKVKHWRAVERGSFTHDKSTFTEGLFLRGPYLYEGSGLEGASMVRKLELQSGSEIARSATLPGQFFGEGIAAFGGELFQLTWKNHQAFVYDLASLKLKRQLPYDFEGWGLATLPSGQLVASDGSATLHFLAPSTLKEQSSLTIREDGVPLRQLNELEVIGNRLFANLWLEKRIVLIDLASGQVEADIDAGGLYDAAALLSERNGYPFVTDDCLNGIAFDDKAHQLLVTGKRWPLIFAIDIPPY